MFKTVIAVIVFFVLIGLGLLGNSLFIGTAVCLAIAALLVLLLFWKPFRIWSNELRIGAINKEIAVLKGDQADWTRRDSEYLEIEAEIDALEKERGHLVGKNQHLRSNKGGNKTKRFAPRPQQQHYHRRGGRR